VNETLAYAGSDQPARRSFGIDAVMIRGARHPVAARDLGGTPFCVFRELKLREGGVDADAVVVAPLSGHFPFLLRDLVIGLLPTFRVLITDWVNARHVPVDHGGFSFDANIAAIQDAVRLARSPALVIALCQGGMPALAATALLEDWDDPARPRALVLVAAPIDPAANPTRISREIASHSVGWFERNALATVPPRFAGAGRRVHAASQQLAALTMYLHRRIAEGGQLWAKLVNDDGENPRRFPFLDLYTSIMDLDAEHFLDNIRRTFLERALPEGKLRYRSKPVCLRAIRRTALMTIEGAWDDVAAPGQTAAALGLCGSVPKGARRGLVVPRCGHFSLFHGEPCRRDTLPAIHEFWERHAHRA